VSELDAHDDALLDLIAALQAAREDRTGDVAVILRNGDLFEMLVTAIKLLGEAADESNAALEHLRECAQQAATP
jgi:hypothetical protein